MGKKRIWALELGVGMALSLIGGCGPGIPPGLQGYFNGTLTVNLSDTDRSGEETQLVVELSGEGPCDGAPDATLFFNGDPLDRLAGSGGADALEDDACPPLRGVGPFDPSLFPQEVEDPGVVEIREGDEIIRGGFTDLARMRGLTPTLPLESAVAGSILDFSWQPAHEELSGANALLSGPGGDMTLAMQSRNNLLSAILPADLEAGTYTLALSAQVNLNTGSCDGAKTCTAIYVLTRVFSFEITT
jgi:hypothetical protein